MAVPEQIPYVGYIANGVTKEFPITFDLHDDRYLVVTVNKEKPTVGSYTVSNGKVLFLTAPENNAQVELYRSTTLDRDIDYKSYDNSFRPAAINFDFDKTWQVLQEQHMVDAQLLARVKEEVEWRRVNDTLLQGQIDILNQVIIGVFEKASNEYLEDKLKELSDAIDTAAAAGAGANGWTDTLVQTWSGRTQQQKNRDIVHAKDFGLIGDGSDESVKLQAMFASDASTLIFEKGKIYGSGQKITVKDKTIISNDCTFRKLFSGSTSLFEIQNNVWIDRLNVHLNSNSNTDVGILISDDNVHVDYLYCRSNINTFTSSGTWAIRMTNATKQIKNIYIGHLKTHNISCALYATNASHLTIKSGLSEYYRIAYYLQDIQCSEFSNVLCRYTAQSANGSNGENGFLLESITAKSCREITFNQCVVEDAGEHGYRLGGQFVIQSITFNQCISRRSGSAIKIQNPTSTEWHGGCGFKVLGGVTALNQRHLYITFNQCVVEDVDDAYPPANAGTPTHGFGNFCGFMLVVCNYVTMNGCVVRRVNNTYSAAVPLMLEACDNVVITGCTFRHYRQWMRIMVESSIGTATSYKNMIISDCFFEKGLSESVGFHIYLGEGITTETIENIKFINCKWIGDVNLIRVEPTETGTYKDISIQGEFIPDSAITPNSHIITGKEGSILLDITSSWRELAFGFNPKNGSKFVDKTTGTYRFLDGGFWQTYFGTKRYSIPSNAVIAIEPPKSIGIMNFVSRGNTAFAGVFYRTGGSPTSSKCYSHAVVDVVGTVLTGTTGAEDKFTVGIADKIYIENRFSVTNTIDVSFI